MCVGHNKLTSTNKNFIAYPLNGSIGRSSIQINFSQMPTVLIRTIADISSLQNSKYGLPIFGDFPLVDEVIQPNILLQFTVSDLHGKTSDHDKYATLRSGLRGKKHKLIFVIPAAKIGNNKMINVVGVPTDLELYWMCYEDVATEVVLTGNKRKTEKLL